VLLLCDSRDVAFQRDPFATFAAAFAPELAADARAPLLLAAAELDAADGSTRLGREDWNRETIHGCFGYLGEVLAGDRVILCAGTTFATPAGLRAYAAAMAAAFAACNDMGAGGGGADQGVHNALLHAPTRARMADLRARAPSGPWADAGPPSSGGPPVPRALALLDAHDALHAAATVRATRTEAGGVCTMALPARLGKLPRDAGGRPVAIDDHDIACALVHQYDRDAALHARFRALYPE
jgi:hypothetical protein